MAEPITFTVNDKTYALPIFELTSGDMRKIRRMNDIDAWYSLLEMHAESELINASDKLPYPEIADLFKRWTQELKPGESSGSSI
jgi:hypothetical protein